MNEIELLGEQVVDRFKSVDVRFDPPSNPNGHWFMDVRLEDKHVVVEWRPGQGFGVSDITDPDDQVYGQGPDRTHPDAESALQSIAEMFGSCAD